MAAPIITRILAAERFLLYSASRSYARRIRNSIQNVMTHDEETQNVKHTTKIVDPRKNAYLPFNPDDPVQRSLKEASERKKPADVLKVNDKKQKIPSYQILNDRSNSKGMVSDHIKKKREKHSALDSIKFEKLEETDKRFGRLIMRARSRKDRQEHREIVLEGKNLIIDALKAGATLKILYFSGVDTLDDFPTSLLGNATVYKVQYNHLKLWSEVETPQGILGIFEMPPEGKARQSPTNPLPLTVICDSVRDAGNLGTLIRSAAAVGCQKLIATKGCVDVWSGKVLRSAAGCHFRVPILSNIIWPQVPGLLPPHDSMKVFLADNNRLTAKQLEKLQGSLEAVNRIEELHDQDMADHEFDKEEHAGEDEGNKEESQLKRNNELKLQDDADVDNSYKDFNVLSAYRHAPLSVQVYDDVDYTEKHTVLVISGETSGVSLPAKKLAYDHYGECVTIPMESEVESLNSSVAGSVIMFEIAKQYRKFRDNEMMDKNINHES